MGTYQIFLSTRTVLLLLTLTIPPAASVFHEASLLICCRIGKPNQQQNRLLSRTTSPFTRSPWSKIPTHLLGGSGMGSFGQVRLYSSDSKDDSPPSGGFGFQSLSGLFPAEPAVGRYSRPKEAREQVAEQTEKKADEGGAMNFFEAAAMPQSDDPGILESLQRPAGNGAIGFGLDQSGGQKVGGDQTEASADTAIPENDSRLQRNRPARQAPGRTQPRSGSTNTTPSGRRLTHVKPSGEAHMVDVGAKASTKRTAIAIAHVPVGAETYKQIEENSNKKGDVLGTARIAGIMAAKRTPDIIPLCHPIAVTKVEVDVYLVPPYHNSRLWKGRVGSLVAIQARVECVGPTGVEMEALTAVQGAALTVVDMCKASEPMLSIHAASVVYKAGGRKGVVVNYQWKNEVGAEKFDAVTGELKDEAQDILIRGTRLTKNTMLPKSLRDCS